MARMDFNGDGRSDVLWRNDDGRVTNWLGTANGGYAPNFANALLGVSADWQIAQTGDFNGDGRDDILWRNLDGRITNWLGTATGGFADNVANAYRSVSTDWQIAGVGDFNGDGRSDVLWRNDDGRVTDWLGTANGGYSPNSANALFGVSADWQIAQTGDFNGDGRDDILWRNVDGRMTNWLGTATGGFADNVANAYSGVSTDWQIAGVGDFNGDGRSDVLWRNDDGRVTNWLGTANGGYAPNAANALLGVSADWQIAQTGDFNGDGRDDILWRNVDGRITNWLGTATGGFADNYEISTSNVPGSWQVQPSLNGNVPTSVNPNAINGGPGNDSLIGTGASDTINGADGNDTIYGLGGNDNLSGAQGRDTIHGGQGNDVISSSQSADNDILYGESGADTFYFETFTSAQIIGYVPSTSATIMDFQTGIDKIDLHLFGISTNDHNLYWLGEGDFTGANRIEATFKGGVLQVDYNGDRIPDLILNIVGTISQSDFTYTFDPWGY